MSQQTLPAQSNGEQIDQGGEMVTEQDASVRSLYNGHTLLTVSVGTRCNRCTQGRTFVRGGLTTERVSVAARYLSDFGRLDDWGPYFWHWYKHMGIYMSLVIILTWRGVFTRRSRVRGRAHRPPLPLPESLVAGCYLAAGFRARSS